MADVPHERSLAEKLKDKPFVIVGINSDKDRFATKKVCAEKGITWPSFWDGGSTRGPIAIRWNVDAWPTLYLIDAKGVIRYKGNSLRSISLREDPNGQLVQVHSLDEAVNNLINELSPKK